MPFAILHVKWIQYRYKQITENNIHFNHTNQVLSKLSLLQSKIYYYKSEFHAWGFYHPSCVWTYKDEIFHNWLFPLIDFEEIEIVVWNNPEAVTYYHNKIYQLTGVPMRAIKRKSLLYKSGVEYADYSLNHAEGCSHGCNFPCYAMMIKR